VLAISSGKGGVGKSTVSANLAAALALEGHRVGLMDADIYGPNIPRMFGVDTKPEVQGGKIQALEAHGVKLMSLGFIVERDAPAIWRGPIIMKIIGQFLRDVAWGELDYFLVDLPPGTGDAQLSLTQIVRLHGALIVTTPQEMAVGDSLRGAKMFERVGVKVVGVVENMSYFVCPHCNTRSEVFLAGGGTRLAAELHVPLLGQVPLQAGMAELADRGTPIVLGEPESPAAAALRSLARTVIERVAGLAPALPLTAPLPVLAHCSRASSVLCWCLTTQNRASPATSCVLPGADHPDTEWSALSPPGSRVRSVHACWGSQTAQSPRRTRVYVLLDVAFRSPTGVGALD
jgi:ATP-binding protein involved in chromosome partitioning